MMVLETEHICGHKKSSHPSCSSETLRRWSLATVFFKLIRLWLAYNQQNGWKGHNGFWGWVIEDGGASALSVRILILDPSLHHGNNLTTLRFHALKESSSFCRKTPWGRPWAYLRRGGCQTSALLHLAKLCLSPWEQQPSQKCPA